MLAWHPIWHNDEIPSAGSTNLVMCSAPNPASFQDSSENFPIKIGWRYILEIGLSMALEKWFERQVAGLNHQQYGYSE